MPPGEKQGLLIKENTVDCCLPPPPAPNEDTAYSTWKNIDCSCNALPVLKKNSNYSVSFAAQTYYSCMIPANLYNNCIYRICCCGDHTRCSCHSDACCLCVCLISLPKLPCCLVAGVSASIAGIAGLVPDGIRYLSPRRELMDGPFASEYEEISDPPPKAQINSYLASIKEQIALCLNTNNLKGVITLFYENQDLINNDSELYYQKVFLICLAISYVGEEITFIERRKFIGDLADKQNVNGYNSTEGWIPAPLLVALRSTYRHSSELLEFLCRDLGANIHRPFGGRICNPFDLLLLLAYTDLLTNHDNVLFYKTVILKSYETEKPRMIETFLAQHPGYRKLDTEIDELSVLAGKGKNREINRGKLKEQLERIKLPSNIAMIVGQYSALYSPLELKDGDQAPTYSIRSKSASSLIADHSILVSKIESEDLECKSRLSRYLSLPPYKKLPPEEPIRISSGTSQSFHVGM